MEFKFEQPGAIFSRNGAKGSFEFQVSVLNGLGDHIVHSVYIVLNIVKGGHNKIRMQLQKETTSEGFQACYKDTAASVPLT